MPHQTAEGIGAVEPHRGPVILSFGIISFAASIFGLVCSLAYGIGIIGILAGVGFGWAGTTMGRTDLEKIKSGLMDGAGHQQTNLGVVFSRIGFWASIAVAVVLVLLIAFGIIALLVIQKMP